MYTDAKISIRIHHYSRKSFRLVVFARPTECQQPRNSDRGLFVFGSKNDKDRRTCIKRVLLELGTYRVRGFLTVDSKILSVGQYYSPRKHTKSKYSTLIDCVTRPAADTNAPCFAHTKNDRLLRVTPKSHAHGFPLWPSPAPAFWV